MAADVSIKSKMVTQEFFLNQMGIQIRGQAIKDKFEKEYGPEEYRELVDIIDTQLLRLTGKEFMGKSYKFMFVGKEFTFPFIK